MICSCLVIFGIISLSGDKIPDSENSRLRGVSLLVLSRLAADAADLLAENELTLWRVGRLGFGSWGILLTGLLPKIGL